MTVVTRFAPSPTGYLHIGGARTALFNWLYARHHGGTYLLRIEDTDKARSTEDAKQAILDGLAWLDLLPDAAPVYQSDRADAHVAAAEALLRTGQAYRCYCTPEELEAMRAAAKADGRPMRYDGTWRDRDPAEAPADRDPVVRLRAPQTGETIVDDAVQGSVRFGNDQIDDFVLLRADGTPTYMLAVVVDDHDMGITHVIRGDDHLNNAARQTALYRALGWAPPVFAHIPLIHGPDGAKLSKRHGALGIEAYRDEMGYLPEAMRNYLARLGWAHGDEEIFSTEQAVAWFDLDGVGKSAARIDFQKLEHVNAQWLRRMDDAALADRVLARAGASAQHKPPLLALMPALKERAKSLVDLTEAAGFIWAQRPLSYDDKAQKQLSEAGKAHLASLRSILNQVDNWSLEIIEKSLKSHAEEQEIKLGKLAQPLRAALTGRAVSPGIYEVLLALGPAESLARIDEAIAA